MRKVPNHPARRQPAVHRVRPVVRTSPWQIAAFVLAVIIVFVVGLVTIRYNLRQTAADSRDTLFSMISERLNSFEFSNFRPNR